VPTELLTNASPRHHLTRIQELFRDATDIVVCVAFVKRTGLDLLKPALEDALRRGAKVKWLCGLDFYLTDPDALFELLRLFRKHGGGKLLLHKQCRSGKGCFHPKLYCVTTREATWLVVGSANLTGGGLVDNVEVSCLSETTGDMLLRQQTDRAVKAMLSHESVAEADMLSLSRYAKQHTTYHSRVDRAEAEARREIRKVTESELDLKQIHDWLERYRSAGQESDFELRLRHYSTARSILLRMSNSLDMPRGEFADEFARLVRSPEHLLGSDSISRQKPYILAKHRTFLAFVHEVSLASSKPADEVFAIGLKYRRERGLRGVVPNLLTEVMMVFNAREFAVLNKRPLLVLQHFGCRAFPGQQSFRGNRYWEYVNLLKDVGAELGFDSLLQVDHFFNWVYGQKNW
jgi:HKD family nuclease